MPALIRDKYTKLPVTRQRKHQLRKKAKGICLICTLPATHSSLCDPHYEKHLTKVRDYMRKKQGVIKPRV